MRNARIRSPLPLAGEGPGVRALLTGATGFLGSFLLRELLRQPDAQVHALVRGSNAAQARRKLVASLEKFGLWDESLAGRIHIPGGAVTFGGNTGSTLHQAYQVALDCR